MKIYIVTQHSEEDGMTGVTGAFPTQDHALAYVIKRVINDNANLGESTDLTEAEAMHDSGFPITDAIGYTYEIEDAELVGIDKPAVADGTWLVRG